MKKCPGCGEKTRSKVTGYCTKCLNANVDNILNTIQKKRYHKRHPNGRKTTLGMKKSEWKRRGIIYTEKQMNEHLDATECDCCLKPLNDYRAMDHDHATGLFRGTLCRACNLGLGNFGDDLEQAITNLSRYLQRVQAAA